VVHLLQLQCHGPRVGSRHCSGNLSPVGA
jgi:hypothetical protein